MMRPLHKSHLPLLIPANMPFYARVPLVRQLYKMKLKHEQAKKFVTGILEILDRHTKTRSEVIEFFSIKLTWYIRL